MITAQDVLDGLCAPFPNELVEWRVGPTNERSKKADDPLRGQPLCYVDARTVMDRLDSVVGFDNWQNNYSAGVGTSIVCNIGIRFDTGWIWKADGAGPSDMEAEKGALSDAFKRAAVRWGVGRYLYDIKSPWIELAKRGTTAFIPDDKFPMLDKLHDDMAKKCGWGDALGGAAYRVLLSEIMQMTHAARIEFTQTHAEVIAKMPPAMRRHITQRLEAA